MMYYNCLNRFHHQRMSLQNIIVILTTVFCVTSSTVYNVTPDDNINGCHHCLNLQHYLGNVSRHFVSNTQLYFLPGLHHLPTDLIIQNIHNVSLIGSTANGTTQDTVIQCNSVGIVMVNITNLTIKNMVIKDCKKHDSLQGAAVFIKECNFVRLHFVHIYHERHVISLLGLNVLGNSYFHEMKCHEMHFYYNETTVKAKNHNILIDSFHATNHFKSEYGIYLDMSQYSYEITLQLVNTTIQQLKRSYFLCAVSNSSANQNRLLINKCQFQNNTDKTTWYLFYLENVNVIFNDCYFYYNRIPLCHALVKLICGGNITFINFNLKHNRCHIIGSCGKYTHTALIQITDVSNVTIKHSYIYNNKMSVLDALNTTVVIENTTFSLIQTPSQSTLDLMNTSLLLNGPIIFYKNKNNFASVIALFDSIITVHGYIEFSENYAFSIIMFTCRSIFYCYMMKVLDCTTITIANNGIFTYFIDSTYFLSPRPTKYIHPLCLFQYFSTIDLDNCINAGNFSIIIRNNRFENLNKYHIAITWTSSILSKKFDNLKLAFAFFIAITHCYWLPQSAFNTAIPLDVNKQYIKYTNNSKLLQLNEEKTLCYCQDEEHYDCFKDELSSLYPGQTLTVSFYANVNYTLNMEIITELDIKQTFTACTVLNAEQNIQFIGKNCTILKYAIAFPTNSWCELLLKRSLGQTYNNYDIYYIKELPCPLGFVKIDGICQCYPSFMQFGFTDCDIDFQAVLRPSKGWILCTNGQNDSYSCDISQLCPFDYCKPSSFYLNFSTPDLQCQFNRSGILCGQCQQGLSTVFGSHHCQHCSDIYLLLIIPIAIAGIVLVLLLFILNLTVTDGTVNSFILYANIISINSTMFFPDHHTIFPPLRMFISLANLDLGIQTCFYNGMDDYAKVWLQLAFPFYIISVTTLIIIVSRYSITVKRLTTHRATSVLATIFLLTFMNILCTTYSVLFSYSSTSHLPSKHTRLVWSLDANVPLFEAKFILLFVLCIILFSLLVSFTIILLCAKSLIKFKLLHNILDSYQRPYKSHYWFGLQLLMRIIYLYILHLDEQTNITISIIILSIANAVQGIQKPFKNKLQNYHETLLMINLFGLYIFTLSEWWIINEILIFIAGIQFSLFIMYRVVSQFCGEIIRKHLLHWKIQ